MHKNIFSLSLSRLVITSLNLDLKTLLHFVKTCKGCYEILESVELPWQLAVEQEFRPDRHLDIGTWFQTLSPTNPDDFPYFSSILHPVPQWSTQSKDQIYRNEHILTRQFNRNALMLTSWCVEYVGIG